MMGQILHGCARTTAAVRRAIQHSQESLKALAERYSINPKTVAKWRKRSSVQDAPMGPTPRSTVLSAEQEAITKPNHPWINGQVERMNRTLKAATVRAYHYLSRDHLREHLPVFLNAYNFAKRLKSLAGLAPFRFSSSRWQIEPKRLMSDPRRLSRGLNS